MTTTVCIHCHFGESAHIDGKCLYGPGRYEAARCIRCKQEMHFFIKVSMPRTAPIPPTHSDACTLE